MSDPEKRTDRLVREMKERILVLDGAMGTEIQSKNLSESDYRGHIFRDNQTDLWGNNDILSLTEPEIIKRIYSSYYEAGADIITTNTFNSTSVSQKDYRTEDYVYRMNKASAIIARQAADRFSSDEKKIYKFVAGSIGPTNKTLSLGPKVDNPGYRDITFDQLHDDYKNGIRGLIDGGVDILLIETVFDTLNAKAAIAAIDELRRELNLKIPVWISVTVSHPGGRTLSGQNIEAFWHSVRHIEPVCIGLNCGFGPDNYRTYLKSLSKIADTAVSIHPNAGLPDEEGKYNIGPAEFASILKEFAEEGLANIVGGCCGTTPEYIRSLSRSVNGLKPRIIPKLEPACRLSGSEPLTITSQSLFVNIGERTNVAGSSKFKKLMSEGHYEEALKIARQQVQKGAQIIDIGMDSPLIESKEMMEEFLKMIAPEYDISRVPIMIDSSDWNVLESGLKCFPGKGIVNSISLKDGEEEFKRRAVIIRRYGAAVIVMAFDEKGQAVSAERKVDICKRSYRILTEETGFPAEDIIFDPNILTIATGIEEHNEYALNFLNACRIIKNELPYCLISGGISNLSFAFRGNNRIRKIMHSVFLYHAIQAGMDMGIVNSGQITLYEDIPPEVRNPVEDVIFNRHPGAADKLVEIAILEKSYKRVPKKRVSSELSAEESVKNALLNGIPDNLEKDLTALLEQYANALEIIDGPLMQAMSQVGDYFGSGRMFLPQVIKSAGVMKKAIDFLKPHIKNIPGREERKTAKIILATVKGDVHDIGKNITRLILECNNFKVIDLGVMTPADEIIRTAIDERADIIGLSGLISPSLEEMVNVAAELERGELKPPLLIGGATTSKLHTALKIHPAYSGPVFHVSDASRSVEIVKKLLNEDTRERFISESRTELEKLKERRTQKVAAAKFVPLSEARANRSKILWDNYNPKTPTIKDPIVFDNFPIKNFTEFVDFDSVYRAFDLYGKTEQTAKGKNRDKLYKDAMLLLDKYINENMLTARGVIGFFEANSVGDDIEIYPNKMNDGDTAVVSCLRQQRNIGKNEYHCLADFIAPKESGIKDYIGAFALTTGIGIDSNYELLKNKGDEYGAIMLKLLADRLVEAFAEFLHIKVERDYWGYNSPEHENGQAPRGIRPAPGYPACPDHSDKKIIFDLLDVENNIGMELSDNYAMIPSASVCGWYISHAQAKYFTIGRIGQDQIIDYAARKKLAPEKIMQGLEYNLI